MGIYLPNTEMPGRCGHCPCFHAENPIYCQAAKADKAKRIAVPYGLQRPDWCPIVEVPPHGRLIDADKLGLTDFEIVMCDGNYKKGLEMLAKKIEDASTVIPADKDGET